MYQTVDLHRQSTAELFIHSLQSRPGFVGTLVKVLHLRLSVTLEQGKEILQLCGQGLQELTLKVVTNLPDHQNPLRTYLNRDPLQLTTLSLDLSSAFCGPTISLPHLPLLMRIERLHLTNGWVVRHGVSIGLQELRQLTHISFPVQSPQAGEQSINVGTLADILHSFPRLQVMVLWRMPYQESQSIYDFLMKHGLVDHRVVVFNAGRFVESTQVDGGIWKLAEKVVRWREVRN